MTPASPVACDNGTDPCNIFSIADPVRGGNAAADGYPWGLQINYNSDVAAVQRKPDALTRLTDVILDTVPYRTDRERYECSASSPQDAKACILDSVRCRTRWTQIIQHTTGDRQPRPHGNLWYVFLPPTSTSASRQDVCGTNAFGGYHTFRSSATA